MADGGWIYYTSKLNLTDGTNDTAVEAWLDQLITFLTSIPNWTVYQARNKYISDSGWFFTIQHSLTGAQLSIIFIGDTSYASAIIHADNSVTGATVTPASSFEYSLWMAYIPPGSSVAGTNPATSGFIPAQGFLFSRFDRPTGDEVSLNGIQRIHLMTRDDDDLILAWTYEAADGQPWINGLAMFGGLCTPIHPSDTGSRKNEGQIVGAHTRNASSSSTTVQFFKADSSSRLVGNKAAHGYVIGTTVDLYTHDYPWPATDVILYKSGTPATDGVVAGNGIKGWLNPEWYRIFQGEGPAASKQQFDSGNYIFLGDYGLVGWDPSNGEML